GSLSSKRHEQRHGGAMGRLMQTLLCGAGFLLTGSALALADSARFDIPAQAMPQALKAFAAQAHMQLLYQYNAIRNARANAVRGDLDRHAALEQLLHNSGLEAVYTSESAVTIRLINRSEPTSLNDEASQKPAPDPVSMAQLDQGGPAPSSAGEKKSEGTVTAQIPPL